MPSAFPLHHRIIFVKVSHFVLHDIFISCTHDKHSIKIDNTVDRSKLWLFLYCHGDKNVHKIKLFPALCGYAVTQLETQ